MSHIGYKSEFKQTLVESFLNWWSKANELCRNARFSQWHKVLTGLKDNRDIRILKPDKGQGSVILNTADYNAKLLQIISDPNKFTRVTTQDYTTIIKNENSLKYYLKKYIKPHVTRAIYDSIVPTGSQPGYLYGLAKIHKEGVPLRPVVSMLNTAPYNLSQYLNSLIVPHIDSSLTVSSSTEFVEQLKNFQFQPNLRFISLDIVSLFTNIPLQQTINVAADLVYGTPNHPRYSKESFKRLLEFATSGEFLFNGIYYRQVDGISMGSCLGPVLANLFLGHFERSWLASSVDKPLFYRRYVDDTFLIIDENFDTDRFVQHMNAQHENIKFTIEYETSASLSFLDVLISRSVSSMSTTVYRKSTFSPLAMDFHSLVPHTWKRGLILCFLKRAFRLCSTWPAFHLEMSFLRDYFQKNSFPKRFFSQILNSFLRFELSSQITSPTNYNHYKYFTLPYYGYPTISLMRQLQRITDRIGSDTKFAFSTFKVGSYFRLKSPPVDLLRANVVYQFSCVNDSRTTYVGRTIRHLKTRMDEHRHQPSAVRSHLDSCSDCETDFPNRFTVIDKAPYESILSIKEALCIKQFKPSLNTQLRLHGASRLLHLFD
jgi:hypothetical protein